MSSIIVKPLVTEKANADAEDFNRYAFVVDRRANKVQIKKEIQAIYGVPVVKVATMNYQGKSKQRYTKSGLLAGRTSHYKKAVVTVAEGEIIDLYNNI